MGQLEVIRLQRGIGVLALGFEGIFKGIGNEKN